MPHFQKSTLWNRPLADRACLAFCVSALVFLIPVVFGSALNEYLLADSFRLVGQIDFPVALSYFDQTAGFGRNEYRPVMLLSYAWDNLLWKDQPFGYHLTNLLLHTANGVLILLIFRRITGSLLVAFSTAALFAVHPAHHSRVAWIAARDSGICLLFVLLAWLGFLYSRTNHSTAGVEKDWRGSPRLLVVTAVSCAAFLLALLSYEGAVVFPFVLIAIEFFLCPSGCWQDKIWRAVHATWPYFLLLTLYVGWWLTLFHGSVGGHDLARTIADVARNFYRMHYRLFHDIQHWQGVLYLAAAWWLWQRRKKLSGLIAASVALLWLGFLPFIAVRGYADRFGFLSTAGVAMFLGICMSEIATARKLRASLSDVLPVLLVLFFAANYTDATGRRLQHWQEAGQMADSMLAQLKAFRPLLPSDAMLVFDEIPTMWGEAYVFPTGFRAALGRRYSRALSNVSYFPSAHDALAEQNPRSDQSAHHFRYLKNEGRWVDLTGQSQRARYSDRLGRTWP